MEISIVIIAVIVATVAVVYFFTRRQRTDSSSFVLFQQQLDSIREHLRISLDGNSQVMVQQLSELAKQLQTHIQQNTGTISETRRAMDERLDNAARVIGDMHKAMGHLHESLAPVSEIRDILKAPKLRGGFGEVMLEKLLEEMLPSRLFNAQYSFGDGERVDAVINMGEQMVPIDSKFPLDKYQEYLKATTDDAKKQSKKGLASAVKKHIADVAKYIRPEEGTYPFALMYIPSENVYYELFVSGPMDESLWPYAVELRVFPVSSNTLYLYLQTISFGLKGMKIAEHAREILSRLEQLQKNFSDIKRSFEKIGTHLKNAQGAFDDADKRLEKFNDKFASISSENLTAIEGPKDEDVQSIQ